MGCLTKWVLPHTKELPYKMRQPNMKELNISINEAASQDEVASPDKDASQQDEAFSFNKNRLQYK